MRYAVMSTPLGELTLAASEKGLVSIHFGTDVPHHREIVIPCHRVVGHDGSLTGYANIESRKLFL
jgi:O6-methylguanine-DNA--protein-cysteine methyltransferase